MNLLGTTLVPEMGSADLGRWALPHGPTGVHAGAFVAIGACGQHIYVNPAEQVVVAIQSAWRQHRDSDAEVETFMLLGAAVLRALRPDPSSLP
jgi:CubicO group peptidase (beta-lactamase class C family)